MERINILWTGGWDSTFMMVMLRTKEVDIQPYYLQLGRPSERLELNTMKEITQAIQGLLDTKCVIRPVIKIGKREIGPGNPFNQAFLNLKAESYLGDQYVSLAILSEDIKNLELGIEKDAGAIEYFIRKYVVFNRVEDDIIGPFYEIDETKTTNENVLLLFKNFRFPLRDFTKLEMKEYARNEGVLQIMNKTWFCHRPVNNRPCGICRPCIYTIQEGLKYRFSKSALIRYRFFCLYKSQIVQKILHSKQLKERLIKQVYGRVYKVK